MLRDKHHGQACPYCCRAMDRRDARLHPTRDHVLPICRGGTQKIICCQTCNGIKADMLPEVWNAFMEDHPGWWKLSRLELRLVRRAARGLPPRTPHHRRVLQGGAPTAPIVVPPPLIYGSSPS